MCGAQSDSDSELNSAPNQNVSSAGLNVALNSTERVATFLQGKNPKQMIARALARAKSKD
jgi:hypothetical protein